MATEHIPTRLHGQRAGRGGRPLSLIGCFANDPLIRTDQHAGGWPALERALPAEAFAAAPGKPVTPRPPGRATQPYARGAALPLDHRPRLPQIGSVIDKYHIDELLGTGGFAAVYRATHLLLRIPVAIKLLKPEVMAKHPGQAERLCEEARFAAQINHPNVARVYDVTHSERITYIVMEYIDGVPLHDAISPGQPLPPREVLRIGIDVAEGLAAAFAQGMIHRDIKPANILLTRKGLAKIVDLGLAQSSSSDARRISAAPAEVVGTPSYMAPEQALNPERVDFRSDIYSLGVTMYHAATGHLPFRGDDSIQTISMHLNQPVPSPRLHVKGFPIELERMLMSMLAKDIGARPASYAQLLEALRETDQVLALESSDGSRPTRGGLMERIRGLFSTLPRDQRAAPTSAELPPKERP